MSQKSREFNDPIPPEGERRNELLSQLETEYDLYLLGHAFSLGIYPNDDYTNAIATIPMIAIPNIGTLLNFLSVFKSGRSQGDVEGQAAKARAIREALYI